jgi:hypothetical protein
MEKEKEPFKATSVAIIVDCLGDGRPHLEDAVMSCFWPLYSLIETVLVTECRLFTTKGDADVDIKKNLN